MEPSDEENDKILPCQGQNICLQDKLPINNIEETLH